MSYFLGAPTGHFSAVTQSDATNEKNYTAIAGLYIGTAGSLKFTDWDDVDHTITNAAVGWHPILPKRIWSTGTTAADLLFAMQP